MIVPEKHSSVSPTAEAHSRRQPVAHADSQWRDFGMSQTAAIQTFLRLRPCKSSSGSHFEPVDDATSSVEVDVPAEEAAGYINNKRHHWKFAFNGVLDRDASQDDCFERVAQPVVDNVLDGFNGTIFAYGQTGSGKTFTLTGGVSAYAERGIIPRTLSYIFKAVAANEDAEHTVRVSYLEIYNESGFDLLDPRQAAVAGKHGQLGHAALAELARVKGVVEEDDGSVRLKGLSSVVVASEEEAINQLFLGDTNRAVSETTMNAASSRSHCIFTVCVEARPHGSTTVRRSKLHLVDLAGSERVGKSGASGTTLTEALNINSSLHFLELVRAVDTAELRPNCCRTLAELLPNSCRTAGRSAGRRHCRLRVVCRDAAPPPPP